MNLRRALLIAMLPALLATAFLAIVVFDLGSYFRFDVLALNRNQLTDLVARYPAASALLFVSIYAASVGLSVPGATLLTLTSGFLFGATQGTIYAVFGATLGATMVFAIARTSFGAMMLAKASSIDTLQQGFSRHALNYLLFLRLVPLFPFWLVNLAAAALNVPLRTFVIGTGLGITPAALVYASLGSGLGAVLDRGERPDLDILFQPILLIPLLCLAGLAMLPVLFRLVGRPEAKR